MAHLLRKSLLSTNTTCPAENQVIVDQSKFWDSNGVHWTTHRIGWAIAGGCAVATVIVSLFSVLSHCRNYTNPPQQRQILRVLLMPPVYAIISFFSYRFFRDYTYYSLIQAAYEAIGLSAFLLLLIEYVAATSSDKSAEGALVRKDKTPLPIPFCCWRYRPTKPYFMYTVKWSVLQYVIIRPAASVAGIICERLGVLCAQAGFSPVFANAYIECINFISISIALYGLLVFYGLTASELEGRRPLAKFLAIKLIVMFTFYQSFVFSALETKQIITATAYWTTTNIVDGLNALAICIEMVIFSIFMLWAYSAKEYESHSGPTSIGRPLWDAINYSDFIKEIASSFKYYFSAARHSPQKPRRGTMAQVFGAEGRRSSVSSPGFSSRTPVLRSISPAPSPSIPPEEAVHIPLTNMGLSPTSGGYDYTNKESERYLKEDRYYSSEVDGRGRAY